MTDKKPEDKADKPPKEIHITIDRQKFALPEQSLTGATLRELAEPDVGPDRDLFLESGADEEDVLIGAADEVHLRNGMHFFTAPASIQPGRAG